MSVPPSPPAGVRGRDQHGQIAVAARASGVMAGGLGIGAAAAGWLHAGLNGAIERRPATVDEVVGAAATVAVGGVLVWASAALLLSALATFPGAVGAASASAAAALTPPVLRRIVAIAVGVSVASGASPALGAVPDPTGSGPSAEDTTASPPVPRAGLPPLDRPASPRAITVAPGDSLWRLAAAHLGAGATANDIAAEWPRWFEANRAVIGTNPDLIHPGQQLTPPD